LPDLPDLDLDLDLDLEPASPPSRSKPSDKPTAPSVDPAILRGLPLLGQLPSNMIETFVRRIRQITVAPGDRVITEGDPADTVYMVVRGDLVASRGSPPRPLARLGEGSFFGEMALLDETPRSASVTAVTDAELLVLPRDLVLEICQKYPSVLESLMRSLRTRLIATLTNTSPLFAAFPPKERTNIVARFRLREVEPGTVVIREGHRADALYVVLTGRADVTLRGRQVTALSTGDVAGEMSLLASTGAKATVTARTRLTTLVLPASEFQELIMEHPHVLDHLSALAESRQGLLKSSSDLSEIDARNIRRV
jgi:cAMP-dependent protein kinase regulator